MATLHKGDNDAIIVIVYLYKFMYLSYHNYHRRLTVLVCVMTVK